MSEPRTDLASFLRSNRTLIIEDFARRITQLAPRPMTPSALIDHVPQFLDDVSEVLAQGASGRSAAEMVKPVAREHGRQRVRHGYSIDGLVREYGVLCDCIFDHAATRGATVSPLDARILIDCVTAAIADAVVEYTHQRASATDDERRHLAALLEQAPGFVAFLRGAEMRFEIANAAYFRLVGHRELIGKTAREALPELADQGFFELVAHVLQTGEPFIGRSMPVKLAPLPGALLLDFVCQPVRGEDGATIGILVQGQDVTAEHRESRRRAETEAALQLSETRYRTLFESLDEGYCLIRMIIDDAGAPIDYVFLEANRAFERHTGLVGVAGKRMAALVPDHDPRWFETYGRVAATGVAERFESEAVALGRWFDVYATRSGDPALREVAVVFKDITERKRGETENARLLEREQAARKDAEAASQLRDQFLATVSHELRTPLSAILGWAQLLRGQQLPPSKQDRALETIERNARAQAQLIEDLLDVSRILAGQLRIEAKPIDLKTAIDAAVETVMPAALARDVRLAANVPTGVAVMGDAARLQQVAWNLLSNAVKFTPGGGSVSVVLRRERDDDVAELVVSDTGKGISREFQPHVFDRFRQADAAMSRSYGGLGLGLSIVRELVHLHGGTVQVFSAGEGQGTTFTVRLPSVTLPRQVGEPRAARSSRAAHLSCPPQLRGMRIVVVEDDNDTRELLRTLLLQCRAEVRVTASAAEGLAAVSSEPPDLLISDIAMPGEDGYSLIERVRALPGRGGAIPAVALTAHARREDRARALNAGFDNHVAKPVDPDELLAVIVTVARRHRKA